MALPTLLDIAKMVGTDGQAGLIEESIKVHPEIMLGAARTIQGRFYKTLVRTALGVVTPSFRAANAGSTPITNVYENRLVETFILEARFKADRAVADSHPDGAQAYIALEAGGILEGQMRGLCSQFFYGTTISDKGFIGLQASVSSGMTTDATGTTAVTGSSAYFVKFGPKDVIWVWGNGQAALQFMPVRIESVVDPADSTKQFVGYVHEMLAYPGLQVGNANSIGCIKNLTADSGKGLTDALIATHLATWPSGVYPDVAFMTRRSLKQLQASRTATNPTGQPAPFPQFIEGIAGANIPIAVTDSLTDVEAIR